MDLDKVKQVAQLAKLALTDEEIKDSGAKLSQVMKHFEKMAEINTSQVEPLVTPTQIENFHRVDEVKKEISVEELMKNAPASQGHLFKVPPVVGS